ncbi:uncharacterized protein [Henckelia pumila]|uniref:uncharacterized protein n=1 Tax=Henckelia pumila TaxID=405737 RepID=UPI003C6E4039
MVRDCISFCKFSVNVNGNPAGFFGSLRGLRHGDPFVICLSSIWPMLMMSSFLPIGALKGSWDFDILYAVVAPSMAEEIMQIPVLVDEPDRAWIHNSDGVFSVRSAWFPVDEVLQQCGFMLASKCQCFEMSETFTHIFIDGPIARSVWNFFGAIFRVRIPITENFSTIKTRLWLGAMKAMRKMDISVGLQWTLKTAIVCWLRPPPGCFKLNVDGSSRGNPGESSVGGVFRDYFGRVLAFFSEFNGVGTNVRAEIWAVWKGFLLCSDLSFFPLWIETDS